MPGQTICVVDDNDDVRGLLVTVLRQAGFGVVSAADGGRAMAAIEAGGISIVVTDIVMPDREGLELIGSIRSRFPRIRILAISGAGELRGQRYLQLALRLGADDCLAKPFTNAEFLSKVGALAGASRP